MMKQNIMLGYSAPEVEIVEVIAECGYGSSLVNGSFGLDTPDYEGENGGDITWN